MTSLNTLTSKSTSARVNRGNVTTYFDRDSESQRQQGEGNTDVLKLINDEDEIRKAVSLGVRRQVEVEIYIPCSQRLTLILEKAFLMQEKHVAHITSCIVNQPQSFYGIPVRHISPSSWDSAVCNMKELRTRALPIDRIDSLLRVAKDIPHIYQEEHPDQPSDSQQKPLGADDILPVFIYVLVRAQLPHVVALNQELQALCDPDRRCLFGEE